MFLNKIIVRKSENKSVHSESENEEMGRSSTPNELVPAEDAFQAPSKDNISEKLREQLKLLKMGKPFAAPTVPRIEQCRKIITRRNTISTALPARKPTISLDGIKQLGFLPINNGLQNSTTNYVNNSSESLNATETDGTRKEKRLSGGVIESLFKRLKSFEGDSLSVSDNTVKLQPVEVIGNEIKSQKPNAENSSMIRVRKISAINQPTIESHDDSQHSTCSSADFVGFDSLNKTTDVSNLLLPTPRVERTYKKSVFVSEELDAFMKENALDNVAKIVIRSPPKIIDEAMITEDAQPPNMSIPERPGNMQKPRTLAEKRLILQRQKDVRYLMIEHESTVYHELKKRVKLGTAYSNLALKTIQDAEIPFTRDCWRVTSWINTQNNHFFYRTIRFDDQELKLTGGRGNNEEKLLREIRTDEKFVTKSNKCCSNEMCEPIENIQINNYDDFMHEIEEKNIIEPIKIEPNNLVTRKLSSLKTEYVKPSPLCKKVKNRRSLDIEFSQIEILELPKVQLEVWPEIGQSLPDTIKPLMKTIIGDDNIITPMWANFAVSVIQQKNPPVQSHKQRRKYKKPSPERKPSFVFDIPYVNNQTKMLVRRRRKPTNYYNVVESMNELDNPTKFNQDIDQTDALAVDCAHVLSNMIHSVAVSLNENNFIHNDPDIDYVGKIVPNQNQSNGIKALEGTNKDKSNSKTDSAAKAKIM